MKQSLLPHEPNGMGAVVLGARTNNIGGEISRWLHHAGWQVVMDDCARGEMAYARYQPPQENELEAFDACVITLGVTHMERFSTVREADLAKVLRGCLELPLECARRYVQARTRLQRQVGLDVGVHDPIGKIIFIGSYAHDHPFTHCTSYCAAKAGLDMAAQSLAWELMPEGFWVHIIHPHHVQGTPMTDVVRKGMQEGVHRMTAAEAEAYSRKDLRMPDIMKPQDIAAVTLWLLTNKEAGWLCGRGLNMYGGVR